MSPLVLIEIFTTVPSRFINLTNISPEVTRFLVARQILNVLNFTLSKLLFCKFIATFLKCFLTYVTLQLVRMPIEGKLIIGNVDFHGYCDIVVVVKFQGQISFICIHHIFSCIQIDNSNYIYRE